MKSVATLLFLLSNILAVSAFAPHSHHGTTRSPLAMALMVDAPATPASPTTNPTSLIVNTPNTLSSLQLQHQSQPTSIHQYLESTSSSSSTMISVQEYKKPTPEEIAAKKRNFNLWFWGGGFVAPFLATFYYFGFKFWER